MRSAASITPINKQTSIRTSNTARIVYEIRSIFFSFSIDIRYQYSRCLYLTMGRRTNSQISVIFTDNIYLVCSRRWVWLFIYSLTFRSSLLVVQKLIGEHSITGGCASRRMMCHTPLLSSHWKCNLSILFRLKKCTAGSQVRFGINLHFKLVMTCVMKKKQN